MLAPLETQQSSLFAINANYKLWVYAVLVVIYNPKTGEKKWIVKFGDTRQNTYDDAHRYATTDGNTVGKLQGLVGGDIYVLAVEDVTDVAISLDPAYDPTQTDVNVRKGFDNRMRPFMPGKSGMLVNEDGGRSLELHVMDDEDGTLTYERCEYLWKTAIATYKNGGTEIAKDIYESRPYLIESFVKTAGSQTVYKHLLAAATGAGKETSTLALLIHIHDQKHYDNTKINVSVATIPSTTSESFNELATVAGMNVGDYGFVDFSRIKPYITEQWFKGYEKDCSEPARDYIRKTATIVKTVADIPTTHKIDVVPVLFGSFHDLALKSNKIDQRYAGLDKRIGTLAIGEAHQMLSNSDNKMWKSLNTMFGKKCFKLFITGTPYDFIYGNAAAEFFGIDERSLFTRNDLYKDKRNNPNSHYKDYPDFNFYGINVQDVVEQLKKDYRWDGDENGFTFNKLFTYDPEKKKFIYEKTILWLFKRMFGMDAFSENGDPLSIYNAPGLCDVAKRHGMIALPVGNSNASAAVYINALKNLLVEQGVFPGEVFDAYDDDLGDRKDDIANAKGMTLTLTCNKDCTGANIPELGYFVFMRKLGDSVKFFEQATGRVGRKYAGKKNCGVFLADIENSMNVMLTIEEKISAERDEDFSVREMIEELLANYNFFTGRNGEWGALDPIDFAATLEELNSKGNYGINQCLRNTDPDEGFDLFFANTTNSENKRIDINSNGNAGAKNSNRNAVMEQMGLPFDKNSSFKQNWINAKLTFASKCRLLAFLKGAKTVKECVNIIEIALEQDDKETLNIVGKGVEWFPTLMTDEHIDVRFTNRWIQKFNDNRNDFESAFEMFADPIHKTDTFIAEPNRLLKRIINKMICKLKKKKDVNFIDPCGGRGGFIIYFLALAKESGIDINMNNVYYNDIDTTMTAIFKQVNKEYNLGIPEKNITSENFLTMEFNMKFSAGTINPPYEGKARTHQKFFNKLYDLIEDDGVMASLQPATTYFNKKNTHLSEPVIKDMTDIIKNNTCEVEIENPEIFDNAGIQNDLSVTYVVKDKNNTGVVDKITYKDNYVYTNVPLEDISQTVIDPALYASIRSKYEAYCVANGNLEDAISKKTKDLKAALPKIRGTRPTDNDFYTFIPKVEKDFLNYYNAETSDFGVVIDTESDKDNVYDYLRSYVARFGLALLKFSQNTANKEFAMVPLVDFKIKHTDQFLFNMLGLTTQEIDAIKKVICNYYAR